MISHSGTARPPAGFAVPFEVDPMPSSRLCLPLVPLASLGEADLAGWAAGGPDFSPYPKVEIADGEFGFADYAVLIDESSGGALLPTGGLALFQTAAGEAVDDVFAIAVRGGGAAVRRLIARPMGAEGEGRVRKSFMTPTPLHVPGSRISPIPRSAHDMLFHVPLTGQGPVAVVPPSRVLFLHPLMAVIPPGYFCIPG